MEDIVYILECKMRGISYEGFDEDYSEINAVFRVRDDAVKAGEWMLSHKQLGNTKCISYRIHQRTVL